MGGRELQSASTSRSGAYCDECLITHGTPGTRAAKQATTTIPIVMAISGAASATICPIVNPCARIIASVQPPRHEASSSSARRRVGSAQSSRAREPSASLTVGQG
jgi:hypothetical protein